ncbi:MAG: cupin domain-containing protein [Verrucomicrobia bacterium]|jgi:quercetin dioxygenase-like cupin family protein|nr:cupin domain-containing protein [Verrucomicrobiota bacterium]MBT7068246.1 cupin domain-containing protein [Verrucomicrobiota bacterium]
MSYVINENDVEAKDLPGRSLKWLVTPDMKQAEGLTFNVVIIEPGNTVKPAHSHKNHEELIYIVSGAGEAYIDGDVYDVSAGSAVLFSKGSVHMVRNSGSEAMKVACFFTPAATLDDYSFHEEIEFPA